MKTTKNARTKIIIGTVCVLALIAYFFTKSKLDLKQIYDSLIQMEKKYLLLALFMNLLQVLFWILRPWPLIPKNSKLPFMQVAKAIAVGQFLNAFAPARAGDVTKVLLLSSNKTKHPLKPTTAVGVLTTDKIVDLIAVLLLAFFSGAYALDAQRNNFTYFSLSYFLFIPALLVVVWFVLSDRLKEKIKHWYAGFLLGIKPLFSPKASLTSMVFAFSVWVSEALAILLVLKASGITVDFSQAVYLMCIVNLGILIPVSLANVGAFEAAFVYGASKFNIGMEAAVALAITQHFLQFIAMGLWAISLSPRASAR